jgi:uncharacterized protein YydD (DUF2326 family)
LWKIIAKRERDYSALSNLVSMFLISIGIDAREAAIFTKKRRLMEDSKKSVENFQSNVFIIYTREDLLLTNP